MVGGLERRAAGRVLAVVVENVLVVGAVRGAVEVRQGGRLVCLGHVHL